MTEFQAWKELEDIHEKFVYVKSLNAEGKIKLIQFHEFCGQLVHMLDALEQEYTSQAFDDSRKMLIAAIKWDMDDEFTL